MTLKFSSAFSSHQQLVHEIQNHYDFLTYQYQWLLLFQSKYLIYHSTTIFPFTWKMALVKHINKKGSHHDIVNYKRSSLLQLLPNVMEQASNLTIALRCVWPSTWMQCGYHKTIFCCPTQQAFNHLYSLKNNQ